MSSHCQYERKNSADTTSTYTVMAPIKSHDGIDTRAPHPNRNVRWRSGIGEGSCHSEGWTDGIEFRHTRSEQQQKTTKDWKKCERKTHSEQQQKTKDWKKCEKKTERERDLGLEFSGMESLNLLQLSLQMLYALLLALQSQRV